MYDPTPGRWTTEDPLGFAGGDPNLYRYCGDDPVNETDPTGTQAFALTGKKADEMVNQLRSNGIDAVSVPLGDYNLSGVGSAPLYLILNTKRKIPSAKEPLPLDNDVNNARISFNSNKVFYNRIGTYGPTSDNAELDASKLTPEQRLTIFNANIALLGPSVPSLQILKNTIGYQEFKDQGWKKAGLGAVFAQVILEHGNEGLKLLEFAQMKKVRIESDNDAFWFTEKEYRNGTVKIAESKRRGLKRATTVEEAANYLYKLLNDNRENIEEWSNRNYNDPTSAAQMSDRMTDPHTGSPMPLHVGGRGGLARGFDDMLSEAADQIHGLMWNYALSGLNIRTSAAARWTATEREIQMLRVSSRTGGTGSRLARYLSGKIDLAQRLRTGTPFTKEEIIAALQRSKQTVASRRVLEALEQNRIQLALAPGLRTGGAASPRVIKLRPDMKIEDTLGLLVQEGIHVLDIADGVIPATRTKATPVQELLAEARGWSAELEFLKHNKYTQSASYELLNYDPVILLLSLGESYLGSAKMDAIPDQALKEILGKMFQY